MSSGLGLGRVVAGVEVGRLALKRHVTRCEPVRVGSSSGGVCLVWASSVKRRGTAMGGVETTSASLWEWLRLVLERQSVWVGEARSVFRYESAGVG
jgi:hypothetical protein